MNFQNLIYLREQRGLGQLHNFVLASTVILRYAWTTFSFELILFQLCPVTFYFLATVVCNEKTNYKILSKIKLALGTENPLHSDEAENSENVFLSVRTQNFLTKSLMPLDVIVNYVAATNRDCLYPAECS